MDLTPFDRRLLGAVLAGASKEKMVLEFGLPANQLQARLKRLTSLLDRTPEGAGTPDSPGYRLARLRDTWETRAKSGALPAHRDFRMTDLRPWFHDIAVIEVSQSPLRLKPRLMGRNLVACAGVDLSRRSLESVLPAHVRDTVLEPFASCIAEAAPNYSVFTLPGQHLSQHSIHLLILPCASDGRTVDMVIAAAQVEGADPGGCVHRALGAYSRRARVEAFGEFIEARAKGASHVVAQAVRNLALIAESGTSAGAIARGTLERYRSSDPLPPATGPGSAMSG